MQTSANQNDTNTVTINLHISRLSASTEELAADYKARGMDRREGFNQLIKDRNLQPGVDAKDFFAVYDSVQPCLLVSTAVVGFEPTHFDTLKKVSCQITKDERGVFRMVWADGSTGSNPPVSPPPPDRYKAL